MEWVQLDRSDVAEYGSVGVHLVEAARLTADGHFRVHLGRVSPGGRLGRHPGRWWQLLVVITGSGWVQGGEADRWTIHEDQAVLWAPGEAHESGSEVGMTVAMIQSPVRLPRGA